MNAHATIDPRPIAETAPAEYPDLEIAYQDAIMAAAVNDKAEADRDRIAAEEAVARASEAKDELLRQLADLDAVIADEQRCQQAAIEKWRCAHVTLMQAHERKSQLLVREAR